MKTFLLSAASLFRAKEWYDSKVPMLISASLYLFAIQKTPFTLDNFLTIIILLLFYSIFLSFGYIINDYSDIEVDKKAGKNKVIHRFPHWLALLFVILTALIGFGIILVFKRNITYYLFLWHVVFSKTFPIQGKRCVGFDRFFFSTTLFPLNFGIYNSRSSTALDHNSLDCS